jgi:hypothetical protein
MFREHARRGNCDGTEVETVRLYRNICRDGWRLSTINYYQNYMSGLLVTVAGMESNHNATGYNQRCQRTHLSRYGG